MSGLRLLVVDAYTDAGRESIGAAGCTHAGTLYERLLRTRSPGAQVDLFYPTRPTSSLPSGAALREYDGIVWTGSNLTIHHDAPEVRDQLELARTAFTEGVPSFGSCWAAQLAVVAAGGECAPNPRGREFGVARKIVLTAAGRAHPMYAGKSVVFDGYTSHEDEITRVASGTEVLAGNAFSRVQAVAVSYRRGVFWAVQYHPEYDLREVARLGVCRRAQLIAQGTFRDEADALDYVASLEALHEDPSQAHQAYRLGIDDDVLDEDTRCIEVDNWLAAVRSGAFRQPGLMAARTA